MWFLETPATKDDNKNQSMMETLRESLHGKEHI